MKDLLKVLFADVQADSGLSSLKCHTCKRSAVRVARASGRGACYIPVHDSGDAKSSPGFHHARWFSCDCCGDTVVTVDWGSAGVAGSVVLYADKSLSSTLSKSCTRQQGEPETCSYFSGKSAVEPGAWRDLLYEMRKQRLRSITN